MPAVAVRITRFVVQSQPGWVECVLVDAAGALHTFIEKVPILTTKDLDSCSTYPCQGSIDCHVLAQWHGANGAELSRIDTSKPWGVESTNGITEFIVSNSQLVDS